jgi:alkylation response protein AidB-like acyl-CoA dehydrogenase
MAKSPAPRGRWRPGDHVISAGTSPIRACRSPSATKPTAARQLVLHYLLDLATGEQKQRWLPGFARGEIIGALAMTEPGTGSDLQGIRTSARRDGANWILAGQKTCISGGIMADVVIVAARTDPDAGSRGFSPRPRGRPAGSWPG